VNINSSCAMNLPTFLCIHLWFDYAHHTPPRPNRWSILRNLVSFFCLPASSADSRRFSRILVRSSLSSCRTVVRLIATVNHHELRPVFSSTSCSCFSVAAISSSSPPMASNRASSKVSGILSSAPQMMRMRSRGTDFSRISSASSPGPRYL
jgi:hypothetical protein